MKNTFLYRLFYPLMSPLLSSRKVAWSFLAGMGLLTALAAGLAATRHVPLKMLPFDNKNELLAVLDFDKGTTLERSDAAVREMEAYLRNVPEVTDVTSYVGLASPMDFNGLVRHYYLRRGENVAEIRINLVGKKSRHQQSHGLGLRERDELTRMAGAHGARLKIVETPPGPPVIATIVAELYGKPGNTYEDLIEASRTVRARMAIEPGVVDLDDTTEWAQPKFVFVADKEKAALNGVSVDDVARTMEMVLGGRTAGLVNVAGERNPLRIELRLPRPLRSSPADLSLLHVKGRDGHLVPLAEIGRWQDSRVDQTIYHKNLERVVYIFAETAGRAPADAVVDIQADRLTGLKMVPPAGKWKYRQVGSQIMPLVYDPLTGDETEKRDLDEMRTVGTGIVAETPPKPVEGRTFFSNGSGVHWALPDGIRVDFAGEGEWKITLDVFRDLGLAFGAALVAIYILLVAQTGSFVIPMVVMLAIPLTVLGIMPGFWLLNAISGQHVGGYTDPIFFTATGMIGMIALAGIVTRDSIILVDFIHLSLKRGRSLFDAIMESRVVRLRPILLTAATAMLSAVPIAIDPIFSGLAWSLIFGLLASTIFTLFVIPVAYWLLYANKPGHGLPEQMDEGEVEASAIAEPVEAGS
jgi:multidrug efflux pump subunit AcrB